MLKQTKFKFLGFFQLYLIVALGCMETEANPVLFSLTELDYTTAIFKVMDEFCNNLLQLSSKLSKTALDLQQLAVQNQVPIEYNVRNRNMFRFQFWEHAARSALNALTKHLICRSNLSQEILLLIGYGTEGGPGIFLALVLLKAGYSVKLIILPRYETLFCEGEDDTAFETILSKLQTMYSRSCKIDNWHSKLCAEINKCAGVYRLLVQTEAENGEAIKDAYLDLTNAFKEELTQVTIDLDKLFEEQVEYFVVISYATSSYATSPNIPDANIFRNDILSAVVRRVNALNGSQGTIIVAFDLPTIRSGVATVEGSADDKKSVLDVLKKFAPNIMIFINAARELLSWTLKDSHKFWPNDVKIYLTVTPVYLYKDQRNDRNHHAPKLDKEISVADCIKESIKSGQHSGQIEEYEPLLKEIHDKERRRLGPQFVEAIILSPPTTPKSGSTTNSVPNQLSLNRPTAPAVFQTDHFIACGTAPLVVLTKAEIESANQAYQTVIEKISLHDMSTSCSELYPKFENLYTKPPLKMVSEQWKNNLRKFLLWNITAFSATTIIQGNYRKPVVAIMVKKKREAVLLELARRRNEKESEALPSKPNEKGSDVSQSRPNEKGSDASQSKPNEKESNASQSKQNKKESDVSQSKPNEKGSDASLSNSIEKEVLIIIGPGQHGGIGQMLAADYLQASSSVTIIILPRCVTSLSDGEDDTAFYQLLEEFKKIYKDHKELNIIDYEKIGETANKLMVTLRTIKMLKKEENTTGIKEDLTIALLAETYAIRTYMLPHASTAWKLIITAYSGASFENSVKTEREGMKVIRYGMLDLVPTFINECTGFNPSDNIPVGLKGRPFVASVDLPCNFNPDFGIYSKSDNGKWLDQQDNYYFPDLVLLMNTPPEATSALLNSTRFQLQYAQLFLIAYHYETLPSGPTSSMSACIRYSITDKKKYDPNKDVYESFLNTVEESRKLDWFLRLKLPTDFFENPETARAYSKMSTAMNPDSYINIRQTTVPQTEHKPNTPSVVYSKEVGKENRNHKFFPNFFFPTTPVQPV